MFKIKTPEIFKDEQDHDPSFIRLVRNILVFVIAVNVVLLPLVTGIAGEGAHNPPAFIALSITLVFEIVSFYFVQQGRVRIAKAVVPTALIVAATIIALNTNGLKNVAILGMPIILIVAAILLGRTALFFTTPLAVAGVIIVAVADLNGRIEFVPSGLDDAIIIPVLLIGAAGIIHLLILRLNESLARARASEASQREKNAELEGLRASLEERVNRRTAELKTVNQTLERRARRFEAVAQVLQAVSSIQNLDTLLPHITRVISEQFNVYHTGIFLLDNQREYAVLRATNSPGGQTMLARGHKLKVGQTGIVGFVTATGQPRIALDVGMDAVFFNNPDLPETRSEMALPLRYAGQVIGALDVQSTEPNAFVQDDIETLSILADQAAIAINNARTLEEAHRSLAEAQSAIGTSVRETWKNIRPKPLGLGVQLRESTLTPLEKPLDEEHVREAVERGETVITGGDHEPPRIAVPIRLRGQVIGVMNLQTRGNYTLTKNDADVASAVAERLSLALETATLLQAAQQRASLERTTSDIASRIGASSRFESILQTAAQELSRALGGSDVLVQIEPLAFESSGAGQEVK
jgi:GAF domain-containing protein